MNVEVTLTGSPKEIVALVLELQEWQVVEEDKFNGFYTDDPTRISVRTQMDKQINL